MIVVLSYPLMCPTSSGLAVPAFSITNSVLGFAGNAANACYRLTGTVGDVAAGYSSNAEFSVKAGFLGTAGKAADEILFDGFERC